MIHVKRYWIWAAMWVCILMVALPTRAQEIPEWMVREGVPKPPDFGIRDEARFFTRDAGTFKRISDQLRKLELERGYHLYLVVEPVMIGTNPPEYAARLREAWLPEGDGMVVALESNTRAIGVGRDITLSPGMQIKDSVIPTHETSAMVARAFDGVDPQLAPEAFVETVMTRLVDEVEAYFQRKEQVVPASRTVRIGLLIAGLLTVLALLAIGMGWLVRHSGMAEVPTFHFPRVEVEPRLGAPSGARVTARRFGHPAE